MAHASGSQSSPHASMAPDQPPPQVLYMTPNHRVTKARYVTSSDPRGYVPVYEYPLNGQWIMMDTDDGYVLWTGIWKALGNSKADIVKILESQPDLATKLRRVRGGYLKMQGTWMARDVALELARRVAWNIRYDLVPLFGPNFPDSCLSPDQPGYGKVVTRPPPRTRRSKKASGQASPPGTTTSLPLDSPISPITGEPNAALATELFESPVEGNESLVPEGALFDQNAMYARGAPEHRGRSQSHSQFSNLSQGSWTALASIKQEAQMYDYSNTPPTSVGYSEPFPYDPSSPNHGGVSQMRRGSMPHLSGYPASSSYYQDVQVKHERNTTGDSGYDSFSPVDYAGAAGVDIPSGQQYSQYSQPNTYPQQLHPVHERSRSDSRYAPYTTSAPVGYQSPSQGYTTASAPTSARTMAFPQSSSGYSHSIDQYPQQTHHTQQYHSPPMQRSQTMPHISSQQVAQSSSQYPAGVPTPYEYGYGYQPSESDLQQQHGDTHYQYPNQY